MRVIERNANGTMAQTIHHLRFEVLVVNDGSSDGTQSTLEYAGSGSLCFGTSANRIRTRRGNTGIGTRKEA